MSTESRSSRRRLVDPTALVAGVVLAALGVAHLVAEANDTHVDLAWAAAAALVALGVLAIAAGVVRVARDRGARRTTADGDGDGDPAAVED